MEDLLGTGTVLKQVLAPGDSAGDNDLEAPRKFFALIDIDTRLADADEPERQSRAPLIESESHKDFLLSVDADLFAGAHLVLPLMNINETARYVFDPKFAYGSLGNSSSGIPADAKLECVITLKSRVPHEEFVENHLEDEQLFSMNERLSVANRKRERGNFWFTRADYHNAITLYKSARLLVKNAVDQGECVKLLNSSDNVTAPDAGLATAATNGKSSPQVPSTPDTECTKLDIIKCLVAIQNNLAQCYIKTDELCKASKCVEKILKLDPNNLKALFRQATIQSSSGHSNEAIQTLQAILKLDPDNKPSQALLVKVIDKAKRETERERGMYRKMFSA